MSIGTRRLTRAVIQQTVSYNITGGMLKIGAGGMVTGIQIAGDGTKVIHTDVYGDYGWDNTADKWRLDHTSDSVDDSVYDIGKLGATCRAISYSQPNRQYKAIWKYLWRSDNYGVTWQKQQGGIAMYPNGDTRGFGPRLVVDPANPDHAFFGSSKDGLWRTTDGNTWQKVTTVPVGIPASWPAGSGRGEGQYTTTEWSDASNDYNGYGVGCIAFDSDSGLVSGRTKNIAVGIQGQGVWLSSDGGQSWSQAQNMPYVFSPESISYAPNGDMFVLTPRQTHGISITATGGTYTITFDGAATTSPLAFNAPYSTVQAAINDLGLPYTGFVDAYPWNIRGATYGIWNRTSSPLNITINTSGLTGGTATIEDYTFTQWAGLKTLWRLRAGSWTNTVPDAWSNGQVSFAVDKLQPGRIALMQSAGFDHPRLLQISTNYGDSWGSASNIAQATPDDVPWLNQMFIDYPTMWFSALFPVFDTQSTNIIWLADGFGVRKIVLSNTSNTPTANWYSAGRGIEELVGNDIQAMSDGSVVCASWDRPLTRNTNRASYPSTLLPSGEFGSGWSVSRAVTNSSFVAASITNHQDGSGVARSGFSADNGATWTAYPTIPAGSTNGFSTFGFGQIVASTPNNHLWVGADAKGVYYTTNQGVSWAPVSLPGGANIANANDRAHYIYRRPACSDAANTFYLFVRDAGVYRTTDGGATWTQRCTQASMPAGDYWWNVRLYATPGKTGELWLICGLTTGIVNGETVEITNNLTIRSVDGGMTWTVVTALQSISAIGFGVAMPTKTERAILAYGYLDGTQRGLLFSDDGGVSWTWLQKWASKHFAEVRSIDGDLTVPGRFYLARGELGHSQIDIS